MLVIAVFLLVPATFTLLAFISGIRISTCPDSTAKLRAKTWSAMLCLAVVLLVVCGLFTVRVSGTDASSFIRVFTLQKWLFVAGAVSSIAALISSATAQPGFRFLGVLASLSWTICFSLTFLFFLQVASSGMNH